MGFETRRSDFERLYYGRTGGLRQFRRREHRSQRIQGVDLWKVVGSIACMIGNTGGDKLQMIQCSAYEHLIVRSRT